MRIVCIRASRLDYDIAVGVSGSGAKDKALSEVTQPTEPMPYNNSDEFAVSRLHLLVGEGAIQNLHPSLI